MPIGAAHVGPQLVGGGASFFSNQYPERLDGDDRVQVLHPGPVDHGFQIVVVHPGEPMLDAAHAHADPHGDGETEHRGPSFVERTAKAQLTSGDLLEFPGITLAAELVSRAPTLTQYLPARTESEREATRQRHPCGVLHPARMIRVSHAIQ
ncbi:hypothetical protein [Actinomadura rudentiformis]|uniref:Uncharacterized protein n=1 Tax=Actinomadura rudentiformis TaxID=359158 RepID=A0A6H9YSJ8_9ACTN|nr:hypothetical protein [Actinomadura rudentiformis]KAB2351370.1 hypothetical protein F8566_03690 [Actinomadura rudentiformis]